MVKVDDGAAGCGPARLLGKNLMKKLVLAATAALGLLAAGSANAAVSVTSAFGAPDPGPNAGESLVINFDPTLEAGVTLTGNYLLALGSAGGLYADPADDGTNYLSVPKNGPSGTAEMDFDAFLSGRAVRSFSFYWGSIDSYNTLELLDKNGGVLYTIGGGAIPPANGDQSLPATNRRVTFTLTGADQNLGGLRFTSGQYAFESDTFAFNVVPEPATWAMMLMGFGAAGAMIRSRRRTVAA